MSLQSWPGLSDDLEDHHKKKFTSAIASKSNMVQSDLIQIFFSSKRRSIQVKILPLTNKSNTQYRMRRSSVSRKFFNAICNPKNAIEKLQVIKKISIYLLPYFFFFDSSIVV